MSMGRREDTELDRELAVLPPELRWREWMRRIEAVLFASTTPVAREDLARVVGQGASVDLGVDRTWGSCGAFSVCDGQPTIENCGPCDGYSVSPFGRPTHPPALSHAGIGNVIN